MERDASMKKLIDNWKKSVEYAEFQFKLIEKRKQAMQINEKIMNEDVRINEKELVDMLNVLIDVYASPLSEDEITDDMLQSIGTREEIILDHETKMSVWYSYLYMHIKEEKYEIASLIKKVIVLEKKEFFDIIKSFRFDLYSDEEFVDTIQQTYITYATLLNKKLGFDD